MRRRQRQRIASSLGFTLIELLVVVVILGILVGLLVPAVMNAVNTANNAAVAAEIQAISQAIAAFKNEFGTYPPSRIIIAEDGDYGPTAMASFSPGLVSRSVSWLRRSWPRMAIATDGTKPVISGGWYDVNGDTNKSAPYVLYGHEALCIFLGGVPQRTAAGFAMTGFAKDPKNPFQGSIPPGTAGAWPYASNRTVPYMDFRPGSLKPTKNLTLPGNADQLPGYTDRFGGFFAYFSAYTGGGYDPEDVNIPEPDEEGTTLAVVGGFQASNAPDAVRKTTRTDIVASQSPNPYLADSPLPVTAAGAIDLTDLRPKIYMNANTYQIISPGRDGKYGIGGQYNQKSTTPLPFYASANVTATGQTLGPSVRAMEKDNVTNFSGGKLD